MPFTEDLSVFFNPAEFAVFAMLDGVEVVGLFDNAYETEDMGGGVSASGPAFTLPSSSVPSPVYGLLLAPHPDPDKVTIPATYKVAEPMPDGSGVTTLRLRT